VGWNWPTPACLLLAVLCIQLRTCEVRGDFLWQTRRATNLCWVTLTTGEGRGAVVREERAYGGGPGASGRGEGGAGPVLGPCCGSGGLWREFGEDPNKAIGASGKDCGEVRAVRGVGEKNSVEIHSGADAPAGWSRTLRVATVPTTAQPDAPYCGAIEKVGLLRSG